jgi:hypothetical protein
MTKTSHRFGNGSADACGRSSGPRGFDARPTAEPFAHCCASQLRIDDIEQAAIRSMAWQSRAVDQFIRSRSRSRAGRGLRLRVRPGCDPKANEAVPTPRAVIAPDDVDNSVTTRSLPCVVARTKAAMLVTSRAWERYSHSGLVASAH